VQLASACQSSIRQDDAVTALQPDEARPDQGGKDREGALVDSTASPG
jgi:hypothetical protein